MAANSKKSLAWMMILILLGLAAFCGGTRWLTIIVPAAMLIWFSTRPSLRSGRN